jgi:hypothetical protein
MYYKEIPMAPKKPPPPFSVRIPEGLRARLEAEAAKNRRSAGQELLFRLEQSLDLERSPPARKRKA